MKKLPFDLSSRKLFEEYASYEKNKGAWHSFIYLYSFVSVSTLKTYLFEYKDAFFYTYVDNDCDNVFMIGKKENCDVVEVLKSLKKEFKNDGVNFSIKMYEDNVPFKSLPYEEDRDSFEYVYNTSDLKNLEGRKYRSKRAHVKTFFENHEEAVFEKGDISKKDEYSEFILNWLPKRIDKSVHEEKLAAVKSLDFMGEDGYKSCAVRCDGKVIAFSSGLKLDKDNGFIMFEKADNDCKGCYAFINQSFVNEEFNDTLYINRDQDIGLEGLRQAKMSYYPSSFKKVYKIK